MLKRDENIYEVSRALWKESSARDIPTITPKLKLNDEDKNALLSWI